MRPAASISRKTFAESRNVAKIAARQHDPVGRMPVALVHQFDHDGLLSFDAERIDGIQQINTELLTENTNQLQNLIEIRFNLKRKRAVFQCLRKFAI